MSTVIQFSGNDSLKKKDLVTIPEWSHLFPSRTQKLSTLGPKIAVPAIVNRGSCRFFFLFILIKEYIILKGDLYERIKNLYKFKRRNDTTW